MRRHRPISRRTPPVLVVSLELALIAVACTACSEYVARRDTLTIGSGEAVNANIAMHVIDPWSRASRRVDDVSDGERAQRAMERYHNPNSGNAAGLGGAVPVGASTAPPSGIVGAR